MIMGLMNTLSKFCIMKSVREKAKEKELEKDRGRLDSKLCFAKLADPT